MTDLTIIAIASYLLGSIPWSYLVAWAATGSDLRSQGTGNLGARNVFRVAGIAWAILAYLGDAGKGALAVILAGRLGGFPAQAIAVFCVVLGHNYSIWLKGQGGKGLATASGALAVLSPLGLGIILAAGAGTLLAARNPYIAAIAMIAVCPVALWWSLGPLGLLGGAALSILVLIRHWKHLKR